MPPTHIDHRAPPLSDDRRHAPATERNRQAIYDVLKNILPQSGILLEIASGTGEHAAWLAPQLAPLIWQTSEYNPEFFPSIASHLSQTKADNIRSPIPIDVTKKDWNPNNWGTEKLDAAVCINMIHISPWYATQGLFSGVAQYLKKDAPLYIYGPFFQDSVLPADSNLHFNESLRQSNSEWGIRKLEDVCDIAVANGLKLESVTPMPANNLSLVFRQGTSAGP